MIQHEFPLDEHEHTLPEREHFFGFLTEGRAAYDAAEDREANFEVLKTVPGIDPVLAVVDGHPEDIPQSGWLINSKIAPGYGGVIRMYKYPEGALIQGSVSDRRERSHLAEVRFELNGCGEYTVAYENPAFPHKDVEPQARTQSESFAELSFADTNVIELENGGRLLDQKDPPHGVGRTIPLMWTEIDSKDELPKAIAINRATDDAETVKKILAQLSYSMGMTESGGKTLLDTASRRVGLTL
jgi:hypothetical protein